MTLRPRGVALPATAEDVNGDTRRRVLALEQRTRDLAPVSKFCVTAHTTPGLNTQANAVTGHWYPYWSAVNLEHLFISTATPIGFDIGVTVYVNGAAVATATIVAGASTGYVAAAATLRPLDHLSFGITAGSEGIQYLVAQAWLTGPIAGCTGGLLFDAGFGGG